MNNLLNLSICFVLLLLVACSSTKQLKDYQPSHDHFFGAVSSYEQSQSKEDFKILAHAFEKENEASIDRIQKLKQVKSESKWENIIDEIEAILKREDMISMLDLSSKQIASLDLFDIDALNKLTSPMAADACAYHYPLGVKLLLGAEKNNDSKLARKAHQHLDISYKYNANYKNTHQLVTKAFDLASQHVLITLDESVFNHVPSEYLFAFEVLDVANREWVTFHGIDDGRLDFDLEVKLSLDDFNVSDLSEEVTASRSPVNNSQVSINANSEKALEEFISVLQYSVIESATYSASMGAVIKGKITITDPKSNEIISEQPIRYHEGYSDHDYKSQYLASGRDTEPSAVAGDFANRQFALLGVEKQLALELIEKTKVKMIKMIDQSI